MWLFNKVKDAYNYAVLNKLPDAVCLSLIYSDINHLPEVDRTDNRIMHIIEMYKTTSEQLLQSAMLRNDVILIQQANINLNAINGVINETQINN